MKPKNTNIKNIGHVEVVRSSADSFSLCLSGESTGGKRTKVTVELGWWIIPYLLRTLRKAWAVERARLVQSIMRTDDELQLNKKD